MQIDHNEYYQTYAKLGRRAHDGATGPIFWNFRTHISRDRLKVLIQIRYSDAKYHTFDD